MKAKKIEKCILDLQQALKESKFEGTAASLEITEENIGLYDADGGVLLSIDDGGTATEAAEHIAS